MPDADLTTDITDRVRACLADGGALMPEGGASKRFLGREVRIDPLALGAHRGVVSYAPTELVVSARCGTPLAELEQTLAARGQMLPFEPPHFGPGATIGGTVAAGLSGPRRPYAGAARDFVLGARLLNGKAEVLGFGGQVMKNVAGYDVSRLLTGSMGTLGAILEVSLKVLPQPASEVTLAFEHDAGEAIQRMNEWAAKPLPLSAACHLAGRTLVRLSGTDGGVGAARSRLGGEVVDAAEGFWRDLREHRLDHFAGEQPLWRISVPATTPVLALPGQTLMDWGGALRWLRSDADADSVRAVATSFGGHVSLFRGGDRHGSVFHPLSQPLLRLHQRVKAAFDPAGVFSPGRLYPEL